MTLPNNNLNESHRCPWAKHELEIAYHDMEWGKPSFDDHYLFEMLIIEGVQAGLSWLTVLKKRAHYQKVYDGFDPEIVAKYDEAKIQSLLNDPGIIRNKVKVRTSVKNAIVFLDIQKEFGSFSKYIWAFVDGKPIVNQWKFDKGIPPQIELSLKISKDLKKRGMSFVGSTIMYSFMQGVGMVNDHLVSCPQHKQFQLDVSR